MVQTLEKYLTEDFHFDLRDISEIEALLKDIVPTYINTLSPTTAWPYAIMSAPTEQATFSISTTAMVLDSLLRLCGYFQACEPPKNNISPVVETDGVKKVTGKIIEATELLFEHIYDEETKLKQTTSSTFGVKDIFTHAWLSEISVADWSKIGTSSFGAGADRKWQELGSSLLTLWKEELDGSFNGSPEDFKKLFSPDAGSGSRALPHAFGPLRLIQTLRRTDHDKTLEYDKHYKYFERLLHEQLSFSSIPDSRFDPAELAFCLEGMLLCQRSLVDRSVFDRVLSVLTSVQHENAYWRPVKPFLATDRGLALFPVSVEVANSLLRSCAIFDSGHLHDTYGSKCIALLRRYWQWLRARSVRISNGSDEYVGWHSEHVNEMSVIHTWETSQVVGFLLEYRKALQGHIARTTLVRSRFHCKHYKRKDWNSLQEKFEPVSSLGDALSTYSRIKVDFIDPHHPNSVGHKNFSMLLYGPPGTGKTTVAECIAKALARNLVTITVSDFLAGGEAQMEARAKNIFDVLMSQEPCVVLFDEIDNFLLDRDTPRYSNQDSVFQFMTPGMLTKLNDLRRSERAIFIIATNYEERIDPAIKRTGRIDFKYLLLPPDMRKRGKIIESLTCHKDEDENVSYLLGRPISDVEREGLAKASLYLGFKDIEAATNQAKQMLKPTVEDLEKFLVNRARTTSLEAYTSRFTTLKSGGAEGFVEAGKAPLVEFICLAALALETRDYFTEAEHEAVKAAVKVILRNQTPAPSLITTKTIEKVVEPYLSGKCERIAEAMKRVLDAKHDK